MAITLSTDGYCALADVQALVQQFAIDANSDPSTTEVEGFITEDFHQINAMLRGAGYAAPVAQAGGSLAVSAGNIVVDTAATRGASGLRLTGSGGTLAGKAVRGDSLTIAGDAQPYMVTADAYTSDDGEVYIAIAPLLEKDAAAAAVVSYTQSAGAATVLKKLNALMAAMRSISAAYSAQGGAPDLIESLAADRQEIWKDIQRGAYDLPAIANQSGAGRLGTARLMRA